MIVDQLAEHRRTHPRGQMRRHRREDIAAVEGPAGGLQEKLLGRDMSRLMRHPGIDHSEHAVIRADEVLPSSLDHDRPARAANPWIDYRHMNGLRRKITMSLRQQEGCLRNFVGANIMRYVDDLGGRTDAEYHALHYSREMIRMAEIRCQSDDRFTHLID